ncbi:oligopeptide/dipeptide ABC transporter, ATP-binding protein [Thioflavicoccus mobilis 8321]|uniref:ABC-type dipeptide transporter n=1 Tax=Thioflavicoccus mobilis 8321 TaxID=765912 RepID=L0H0C5_9GAMM|nr:ABC transporter ATP-binding protein [Thioflavicoccus mobilis]AGA91676.1 oligopeptide/dipeptide ABC transporter, ATP-binding protein [Thioflavicoccus mobilis 8321]
MTEPVLEVRDLTVRISHLGGGAAVVDGLNLEIAHGETLALLGESGCGKSMTALALMRLLSPTAAEVAGRVRLSGTDLLGLPEPVMREIRGGRMAMVFQEPQTALNPVLTVGAQIAEAVRRHTGLRRARQVNDRAAELLAEVGIPTPRERFADYPHQLSGGMKQRVMIAMALAGQPQLLIADEPTTALDVTIQAEILKLLKDLQRQSGMALLLITHDLGVVAETADHLAVMYAGRLVEEAPCAVFFDGPAHPYSRRLLASRPSLPRRVAVGAGIPGRVPAPGAVVAGCLFAARCDLVRPECRSREPSWQPVAGGHRVRCHRWADATQRLVDGLVPVQPLTGKDEVLLRVENLAVHFPVRRGLLRREVGRVRAVDGVSLTLQPGRTLALVGESGCGKTTVGRALLRLVAPTAGAVWYHGRDLMLLAEDELRPLRKDLQIVFQDAYGAMNPRQRVGDVIGEGLWSMKLMPRDAGRRRVAELLEQVGLAADDAGRWPHQFSGGQRQRIGIARALALDPRLIVCDEPTSALDVSVQAQILNLLERLQRERVIAYLFITHDLSVVAEMADEVAVMYLGRIVEQGTVDEVLDHPRHPYTRALLSAVPVVEKAERRPVIRLAGERPSPADPPAGCRFHPRCPDARPVCAQVYPPEIRVGGRHSVHCLWAN